MKKSAPPCTVVIFGAKGDLTKRKLVPALYNLIRAGVLSEQFAVVGFARGMTTESFREKLDSEIREYISDGTDKMDEKIWKDLLGKIYFSPGNFGKAEDFAALRVLLDEISQKHKTLGNILFYLATPPTYFGPIAENLAAAKLTSEDKGWRRVIIEKPFGHDYDSAVALDRQLAKILKENQVYRIDHYLGKETVQNIMVLRFANGIFEPIWNRRYIDSVQITVAETLGVESRADYYETSGALRDMVPNHLFQLLSMIAMEPPTSFGADDVRDEKTKVLKAIQPLTPEKVLTDAVRGQYKGYRQEDSVAPTSATETFAALKLYVDNWRWAGVPFYLRTGKKLASRVTEVVIDFKRAPYQLFRDTDASSIQPNRLILQIQPQERIFLEFNAKVPGPGVQITPVRMDFNYAEQFKSNLKTGYETLIFDCMNGDPTLFMRSDQVESAWKVISPILDVWASLKPREFPNYQPGTAGPTDADLLITRDGRSWRPIGEDGGT